MSVSWTRVTDATGYKVQWISGGETFNSPNEQVITEGGTTSYTIPNLMGGTEYTVRVIATKTDADDGWPSARVTGTPKFPAPVQVTGLTVTPGVLILSVSWEQVMNADGYIGAVDTGRGEL